ncbi:hypothetical protein ANTQUA_LOCUS5862 [Anthophora quadrimaculata]
MDIVIEICSKCITLSEHTKLTQRQIAEEYGISKSAVNKRLLYSVKKLAQFCRKRSCPTLDFSCISYNWPKYYFIDQEFVITRECRIFDH